jgi:hypothetical protein
LPASKLKTGRVFRPALLIHSGAAFDGVTLASGSDLYFRTSQKNRKKREQRMKSEFGSVKVVTRKMTAGEELQCSRKFWVMES